MSIGWDCVKHVKVGRGRCWACADEHMSGLQGRVAELEAENKQLCDRDTEANDALVAYETRIAQAVAELGKCDAQKPYDACAYAANALAILKGES